MPGALRAIFGRQTPSPVVPGTTEHATRSGAWTNLIASPSPESIPGAQQPDLKTWSGVGIDNMAAEALSAAIAGTVVNQMKTGVVAQALNEVDRMLNAHEDRVFNRFQEALLIMLERLESNLARRGGFEEKQLGLKMGLRSPDQKVDGIGMSKVINPRPYSKKQHPFVTETGETSKVPPSLDILQDARDTDVFSEHRLLPGPGNGASSSGILSTPKNLAAQRKMVLGLPTQPLGVSPYNLMRHTSSSPTAHQKDAKAELPTLDRHTVDAAPKSSPRALHLPAADVPANAATASANTFTHYCSAASSACQGGAKSSPRPSRADVSAMLPPPREDSLAAMLPPPPREDSQTPPPPRQTPKFARKRPSHLDNTAENNAPQTPHRIHLDSSGSDAEESSDHSIEVARAGVSSMPVLGRRGSSTEPNLLGRSADMHDQELSGATGSRRSSTPDPMTEAGALRLVHRRHTAGALQDSSDEVDFGIPARAVSLNVGFLRSRTPPPTSAHHSMPQAERSRSPCPSLGDAAAQVALRNPCRNVTSGAPEGTSIMSRLLRRLSDQFEGPIDEVNMLRMARETDLLKELESDFDDDGSEVDTSNPLVRHCAAPKLMRVWGIAPWKGPAPKRCFSFAMLSMETLIGWRSWTCSCSRMYQRLVMLIAVAGVVYNVENLATTQRARLREATEAGTSMVFAFQEVIDLTLAVGSLLGLIDLRCGFAKHNLMGTCKGMLVGYAKRERLLDAWSHVTSRETPLWITIWVLVVISRVMAHVNPMGKITVPVNNVRAAISTASFAFSSGLFLALSQSILHVILMLPMMVDAFCFHFVHRPFLNDNIRDWGLLQATLRRASCAVEHCFLVLETITLILVLISLTALAFTPLEPFYHFWLLSGVVLITFVEARLFFKTAEVTEKCARVPSLINSMSFGDNVDSERHFLVEYVNYSAAGFYVFQVRLTAAMALKLAYSSGILTFAVITNIASKW